MVGHLDHRRGVRRDGRVHAYAYDIPWLDDGHEAPAAPARPRFDLWAIADRIVSAILPDLPLTPTDIFGWSPAR